MAGPQEKAGSLPWIKIRTDLPDDPNVYLLAEILSMECPTVVGHLVAFWSWMDKHTPDGQSIKLTESVIDTKIGVPGFAAALRQVGWLGGQNMALTLPHFERHNGASAKARALESEAKRLRRQEKQATLHEDVEDDYQPPENVRQVSDKKKPKSPTRVEESRVDKSVNTPCGVFTGWLPPENKFPMSTEWEPTGDNVKLIQQRGVSIQFIEDAYPEFILYWRSQPRVVHWAGKWDQIFRNHVVREWNKALAEVNARPEPTPLPANWEPDDKTYQDLLATGMPEEHLRASLDMFLRYNIENRIHSGAWNLRFYRWAIEDQRWRRGGKTIVEKLTDRSWANDT